MRLGSAAAGNFGQLVDFARDLGLHHGHMQSHPLQQRRDDAFVIFQQRCQYVYRLQLRIAVLAGDVVRPLHRLLRLHG